MSFSEQDSRKEVSQVDEKLHQAIQELVYAYNFELLAFDEEFLIKSLGRGADAAGLQEPVAYCEHLKHNPEAADHFFKSFHITYTQFFREPLLFAYIEHRLVPGFVQQAPQGREIRIWSAGCSTGQEAYSLAIILDEYLRATGKELRFRIFATDISREALSVAERGEYYESDMQNVKLKYARAYFTEAGGKYTVVKAIKDKVSFAHYDLLDTSSANPPESIFGSFDLVCCNNLLMYYRKDLRMVMLKKLERSLSPNGLLAVSEAERSFIKSNTNFQPVTVPVSIFQKTNFIR